MHLTLHVKIKTYLHVHLTLRPNLDENVWN
jgi:hypothetical protein